MFRTLIYPSSEACDCVVELPHRSSCSQFVVCWRFGAAGVEWFSFWRLKHNSSYGFWAHGSRAISVAHWAGVLPASNIHDSWPSSSWITGARYDSQHSRKLLMMDILMSETCWAHKKWNKIASDIKLVFHSSTITMMHGPINIRLYRVFNLSDSCRWSLPAVFHSFSGLGQKP